LLESKIGWWAILPFDGVTELGHTSFLPPIQFRTFFMAAAELVSMGFSEESVLSALAVSDQRFDDALSMLLAEGAQADVR
jgi:hypothetical protein